MDITRTMDTRVINPDMIQIVQVNELSKLNDYAAAWNRLSRITPPYLPMSSFAWVSSYFQHCIDENESWCCLFSFDGDELVGVLPLVIKNHSVAGLKFHELGTPWNDHTIAVSPLLAKGREQVVLATLLKAAWSVKKGALWLEMGNISDRANILSQLNEHTHLVMSRRIGRYLRVDGDQEAYQSSLSSNFRRNQRKAANKLKKLPDVETVFLSGNQASPDQLEEFSNVEAASWKGNEGTAIQSSPELMAFYSTLTGQLADVGWLEWHFLCTESNAIAGNLAIRFPRSLVIWKLGYDGSHSRCSPGGMLFQSLLDRSFPDADLEEIDLLTDYSWYDNWKMQKREYVRLRFYNRANPVSLIFGFLPNSLASLARRSTLLRSLVRKIRK